MTTLVTRPLDNCTYCARSAFAHSRLPAKARRLFIAPLGSQPMDTQMGSTDNFVDHQSIGQNLKRGTFWSPSLWVRRRSLSIDIYGLYILPFWSYLTGSKNVSVHLVIWPRYDDPYSSSSYFFIEWQSLWHSEWYKSHTLPTTTVNHFRITFSQQTQCQLFKTSRNHRNRTSETGWTSHCFLCCASQTVETNWWSRLHRHLLSVCLRRVRKPGKLYIRSI